MNFTNNASTASASRLTAVIATRSTSTVNRGSPQRATASPPMTHASMPCSLNAANAEAAAPNSCLISRPAAPVPHETQSIPTLGRSDRGARMTGYHQGGRSTTAEIEFRSLTHSHVAMPSTWLSTALPMRLHLRDCLKIHSGSLLYKCTRDVETSRNPNAHTPPGAGALGGVEQVGAGIPQTDFTRTSAAQRSQS